jgi:hypothetical protein
VFGTSALEIKFATEHNKLLKINYKYLIPSAANNKRNHLQLPHPRRVYNINDESVRKSKQL